MPRAIRRSDVKKWLEGSKEFVRVLESELDRVYKESEMTFVSGNPYMTHEIKAKLVGREQVLQELLTLFKQEDVDMFFNEQNNFIVIDEENGTK